MQSISSRAAAESASLILVLGNFQGAVIIDMGVLKVRLELTYKWQP